MRGMRGMRGETRETRRIRRARRKGKFPKSTPHTPHLTLPKLLSNLVYIIFPIDTIEGNNPKSRDDIFVKTADVDIEAFGMRTGTIKRVNSTVATKSMLSNSGIKGIGS
jgi:hypothetical protein